MLLVCDPRGKHPISQSFRRVERDWLKYLWLIMKLRVIGSHLMTHKRKEILLGLHRCHISTKRDMNFSIIFLTERIFRIQRPEKR